MRTSVLPIATLLLLAGCNAIFGLDETSSSIDANAGEPDADPNADDDGDGVANGVDNCPEVANEDQLNVLEGDQLDAYGDACDLCPTTYDLFQHDEDGDQDGDGCDNCPHMANANQEDFLEGALADGIGDLCDPNPTLGGDFLAFFDGFGGPDRNPAWEVLNGDDELTVIDDELVLATPQEKALVVIVRASAGTMVVETSIRVTAVDPNYGPAIGAIVHHDSIEGKLCVLDDEQADDARWSMATLASNGDATIDGSVAATGPFNAGQVYVLRAMAGPDVAHTCRARSNSFAADALIQGLVDPSFALEGGPGIYLLASAVRVPYLIAWGRGPTD